MLLSDSSGVKIKHNLNATVSLNAHHGMNAYKENSEGAD
jgi:hypothetical protein